MPLVVENPVEVARTVAEKTLWLVRQTVQEEIDRRAREAEIVRVRAGLARSPLTVGECAGRMVRLSAQIDELVSLRDKLPPPLETQAPAAFADAIAEALDALDDESDGF